MGLVTNEYFSTKYTVSYDHAALTANASFEIYKARVRTRVLLADYVNATGLAASGVNSFALALSKTGSVTVATGANTATTAIPAGGFNLMALSTANGAVVLEPGDTLSFVATKTGTVTLPAGRLNVELAPV